MHWRELYQSKRTSAAEALAAVRSGDRVYIHQGCNHPDELIRALVARAGELRGVRILHLATMGDAPYTRPEFEGVFRHAAVFMGSNVRRAVQEGRADYIPVFLSEVEGLIERGEIGIDVALLQCAPPDAYGNLSLGTGIDCSLTAARFARRVIVEVNDQCPRTCGDTFLRLDQVHAIVECSHPLAEYHKTPAQQVHRAIARHIAELVPDGATLQLGIGAIPDSVLEYLRGHKDLGIHSEMVSDGVIDLIESGVINNARKTLHPRKVIAGFVLGTRRLFDFIHENPVFEFHPSRYVNDPFVIARNANMVAINSAVEVDITGQVCADSIGPLPFSGVGGQVDFVRGAARSQGGRPILSLPSTAKGGTVSRIVPVLKPGAGVVTSRADVHYVITEHGVAYLHGKTLGERAQALIAIAHPRFRDELSAYARQVGYLDKRIFAAPPGAALPGA